MNDRLIRQIAVSTALAVFALIRTFESQLPDTLLWVIPGGMVINDGDRFAVTALSAVFGGLKLGILIVALEHVLYRIFARRIVGTWAYASSSGNYAIVRIRPKGIWVGGTGLHYTASLYKSAEDVLAAFLKSGASGPFGNADSVLISFKDDKVMLVYQVAVGAHRYDARKGILTLSPSPDPLIMTGIWESTKVNATSLPDCDVRIGDLTLYRPSRFIERYTQTALPARRQTAVQ